MTTCFAEELTSPEFDAFVSARTVAVLPLGAIEPHGPHLPLSTDCDIARGHLHHLPDFIDEEIDVLILPLQTIGHSIEHRPLPGVFSHSAETLLQCWADVVTPFRLEGGRRVVLVSSHGGNSEIVALLATRLRIEFNMLAVTAAWLRFGQPESLFSEEELQYGVHGGAVETSLMLHYWPEAVRTERLAEFSSRAPEIESRSRVLSVHGRTRMGWVSADLNGHGVLGNALEASPEKGAASAHHALSGFADLVADVAAFDLAQLRVLK